MTFRQRANRRYWISGILAGAWILLMGMMVWVVLKLAYFNILSQFAPGIIRPLLVVLVVGMVIIAGMGMWIIRGLRDESIDSTIDTMGPKSRKVLVSLIEEGTE